MWPPLSAGCPGPEAISRCSIEGSQLLWPLNYPFKHDYNFLASMVLSQAEKRETSASLFPAKKTEKRRGISNLVVKAESQLTHSIALKKKMTTTY